MLLIDSASSFRSSPNRSLIFCNAARRRACRFLSLDDLGQDDGIAIHRPVSNRPDNRDFHCEVMFQPNVSGIVPVG